MKDKKILWPFAFLFLWFAAGATYGPFRVLYYQSLSLTGAEIGLLVGIAPLVTMVSLPFMTGLADRTNRHRLVMSFSLLLIIAGLVLFPYLKTFPSLFILAVLFSVFYSPVMSLSNNAAMFMLGGQKDMFGRIRLGGTLGFSIAAAVAGAMVESYGLKIAFWSAAGIYMVAFFVNQQLVHSESMGGTHPERGRVRDLLKNPHYLLFLLISFCGGISFTTINTYLFPYFKVLGAGESVMGLALTIGTIAEIPVLFFANRFIKRFTTYTLLITSLAMTSLRFLLLAVAPSPAFVLGVQLLNGFNHPLLTVAGVTYADEQAPAGYRATAQGLFNVALGGIGAAVGGFLGGLLFEGIGPKGMYWVFCIFVSVILVFVSIVRRTLPPEKEPEPLPQAVM